MSAPVKLLAFAGSTRKESFNKKLVKIAAEGARNAGAEVQYIDLRDYALPLFDEDFERESGLPATGLALKELFIGHDGFLLSAPEYNSSISGVLKNTIDWLSRPRAGEAPLAAFTGKNCGFNERLAGRAWRTAWTGSRSRDSAEHLHVCIARAICRRQSTRILYAGRRTERWQDAGQYRWFGREIGGRHGKVESLI